MKSLGKNFIYQFTYQILAILLPLVTAPYVSRVIAAEGIGTYTYTYTIAYYFYIICMLGFETYGQRRIASYQKNKSERSKEFCEIASMQFVVTIIGTVLYSIYAFCFSKYKLLSIIQILYVASSCTYIVWLFEGVEEFKKVASRNTFIKIISTILIFVFVNSRNDIWIYALIIALSTFLGNFVFILNAKKYVEFVKIDVRQLKKHIMPILLVFIPQISITIFLQMDKLMLGWWSTTRELGYYQNAEKIINIPITLITTVGIVVMPRIVSMRTEGLHDKINTFNRICMNILMYMGVGCMFGLIAVSKDFVPWFFGDDFYGCENIVAALSVTIIFMVWENVLQKQYLVPYNRDNVVVICMVCAAIINVILNVILIPCYGAIGAIIGSIASHLAICVIETVYLKNELPIISYIKDVVLALLPGICMYILVTKVSFVLNKSNMAIAILQEMTLGVMIYILGAFVVLKLTKSPAMLFLENKLRKR